MKKQCIFTGVATALVTPMKAGGEVDFERLAKLVNSQINNKVDALVICGTTGESATLKCDEHIEVIAAAVRAADGRVPIIAGTGSNDTDHAVMMSERAANAGASALLMVTPYYNKTSQRGLIAHFNYIADRVSLPIIVYNVPSRTGVNILPETYAELAKHPKIVAAKEANGDLSQLLKTMSLCGDSLTIYSGNDDQIVPIMSLGGKGVISVLSNILPRQTHEMAELCLKGDFKAGAGLAFKYTELMNALFSDVNPIPVKEAFSLMGESVGECRLPLYKMSDEKRKKLESALKSSGLIND